MLVFAFDRDWTVDVNPHPSRDAVPLEWVRHLAHETEHAVYAIGNQDLAEEAAIPGVVDIVGMHPDDWHDWLGDKQPDGYYERFPTRRERLDLVADLHPEADGYVVVDDIDLSDVVGWDHYHAWDFVPAVERGEIDDALPWARDVATDGGTVAGAMPADATDLTSFIERDGDRGFIRVEHDGGTAIVRSLRRVAPSERTGAQPPVFTGTRLDDEVGERLSCHVDTIEFVHVEPPGTRLELLPGIVEALNSTEHPDQEPVAALADVADDKPGEVAPYADRIVVLLDADDEGVRRAATRCVSNVAANDPDSVLDAVPTLDQLLTEREATTYVAFALCRIASEYPDAVKPAASSIAATLTAPSVSEHTKLNLAAALGRVVSEYPGVVADRVDDLVTLLDADTAKLRNNGVGLLGDIALVHTDLVKPHVDAIAGLFPTDDDYARINATAALSRVAEDFPDAVAPHTGLFVDLLEDEHEVVRENACWALGYLQADEAVEALHDARDDSHADVSIRAQWALAQIEEGPA